MIWCGSWNLRKPTSPEAMLCLEKAIELAGKIDIRQIALDDNNLERWWLGLGRFVNFQRRTGILSWHLLV